MANLPLCHIRCPAPSSTQCLVILTFICSSPEPPGFLLQPSRPCLITAVPQQFEEDVKLAITFTPQDGNNAPHLVTSSWLFTNGHPLTLSHEPTGWPLQKVYQFVGVDIDLKVSFQRDQGIFVPLAHGVRDSGLGDGGRRTMRQGIMRCFSVEIYNNVKVALRRHFVEIYIKADAVSETR